MRRIERNRERILSIKKLSPGERRKLKLNSDFIHCCRDCAANILAGRIGDRERLKRYKNKLRALSDKSTSDKRSTEIVQSGGFLSAILPILAGILGNKNEIS